MATPTKIGKRAYADFARRSNVQGLERRCLDAKTQHRTSQSALRRVGKGWMEPIRDRPAAQSPTMAQKVTIEGGLTGFTRKILGRKCYGPDAPVAGIYSGNLKNAEPLKLSRGQTVK